MVNLKVKFIVSIGKIGFWHISVIRAQLKYFGLSLRALRPLNSPQTLCWMTSRLTFPSKRVRQPHGLCYSELSPCVGEYGQTAHLHRGISQYGAASLGLHGRPSHGPVRPLVRRAIAVRRRPEGGPRRRGYHPCHRVSAHGKRDSPAGHGGGSQERSAQPSRRVKG